ncbi:DUF115 domain-containing protein [Heyndrickxia oleronia]|nr:6-hydroxymethylpterin diphosphokinase MptE-like protein [Heyndrickxia oleronia]MEC1377398.1 DUF115 domain-containing protein [Heyndrickxia oleronia]QQZ06037.1 motility associated factor glycosyltransferase family protein [Heyndrickxia oleronia]
MILIDNRNILRINHRKLLNELDEFMSNLSIDNLIFEQSKKGPLTIKINFNGKTQYLHSKYDPESEAERLIIQLKDIDKYDHVLFIGTGIGYHIKQLMNKYPGMKFSIYEPNKEILYHYLSKYNLKELPISNLQMIFSCTDENSLRYEIQRLIQCVGNNILIAPLPVYEKMYKNEVSIIMESIKELLKDKKSSLIVDASFQKRWTINSIKNFPYVLKTANILQDVDKNAFREKPVILVAAGPSLSDEIENLRYIKEKGLAYIFSVGSAINALVEHDIYPDATCTYDPKERNQNVIKKVKDKNISNIPLIFGSSVGFETLNDYPGPMLHMITNQDTVSPTLLGASGNIKIVNDAPSIAVVTFQLLNLLGFSQIILVGQNLGFRDNQRFAEGINYSHIPNKLSIKEMQNALIVKDTEGNNIKTSEMYNTIRKQLELYIRLFNNTNVINTTKGGAHIEGTTFTTLSDLIAHKLKKENIVQQAWHKVDNGYDLANVKKKLRELKLLEKQCEKYIFNIIEKLKDINISIEKRNLNNLEYQFIKFDKEFNKLKNNNYFQAFVSPMLRVQNKRLSEASKNIRFKKNMMEKGEYVIEMFGRFIKDCELNFNIVQKYFMELDKKIFNNSLK